MKKRIFCFALIALIITATFIPVYADNTADDYFYQDGMVYSPYSSNAEFGCVCGVTENTYSISMGEFVDYASWLVLRVEGGDKFYFEAILYGNYLFDAIVFSCSDFTSSPILISNESISQYVTPSGNGYYITVPYGTHIMILNILSQDFKLYKASECPHTNYYFTYTASTTLKHHYQILHCIDCGYVSENGLEQSCSLSSSSVQSMQCTVCLTNWGCAHERTTVYYKSMGNNTHDISTVCVDCELRLNVSNVPCVFDDNNQCEDCRANYKCPHTDEVILYLPITTNTHSIVSRCSECKRDLPILENLSCDFANDKCVCGNVYKYYPTHEPTRDLFENCTVLCEVSYLDGTKKTVNYSHENLIFDDMGMLDLFGCVRDCYRTVDEIQTIERIKVYIFFSNYVNLKTAYFYTDTYVENTFFIGGVTNDTYDTYRMTKGDTTLFSADEYGKPSRANVTLCDHILVEFSQYDIKNTTYDFKIGASTSSGQLVDLFTGLYDGMLNTFYSMVNFNILGFNLANLILGLFTLAVVVVVLKKVI